jgi:glycosyltransferase involved in cell wall biosynthesis
MNPPDPDLPRVTVLTAALNARAALARTVDSVAVQDFADREHVVVDGASTDGTADWLKGLDAPVRWISEPDSGIAEALNKGLALARGDYVLVLQAGDTFLDAGSLGRAAGYLDGTDIVSFDVRITGAQGERRYASRGFAPKLNFKTTIPHQGAFCHRTLFGRIGGFDESFRIAMDFEFFLRAMRAGATIRTVPEMLAEMPDDGISSRRDWPSLRARFAEERRVHRMHCSGPAMAATYAALWPPYLAYRWLRAALAAS